jgi:radical SAM-linked protein
LIVRFRFAKHGKVRFTSHRDVARMWERALRRAGARVTYSEGFSPRPKLAFGLALPTGHASDGEYVDVKLDVLPTETESTSVVAALDALCDRITLGLPEGMAVQAAIPVPPGTPSLQEAVAACTWSAELGGPTDTAEVSAAITRLLAEAELPVRRERKGRERVDDLRPAIHELTAGEGTSLTAVLATRPASFRPEGVVEALDPSWRVLRACREHQWIVDGATWQEPVPLVVPSLAS